MNIRVPKRPTATAILQWKPRVPNRGEPLKFSHYGIYVANKQARIRLYFEDKHKNEIILKIDGPLDVSYSAAINRVPDDRLEDFKEAWINAKLDYVFATPKEKANAKYDLKIGNTKIEFKSKSFFNYQNPNEILADKVRSSGLDLSEIAEKTGLHVSMVSKQIKGERDITREQAFAYAKFFGCDPADILFAAPQVPIWSTVDFLNFKNADMPFSPGELVSVREADKKEYVVCPRDIYRPDIKAIKVKSPGSYLDGMVLFYYATSDVKQDCIGRLSIIGEDGDGADDELMKDLRFGETQRYFVGILEQHRGKTQITNPDPFAKESLPDQGNIVIRNVTPTFASPIVGIVNPNQIKKDRHSSKLFKANDHVYAAQRQIEEAVRKQKEIIAMQAKQLEAENNKLRDELHTRMEDAKNELKNLVDKVQATEKLNKKFGIGSLFGSQKGLLDIEEYKEKKKRA